MALIIAVIADCLFGEPYLVFHIVHYIGVVVNFLDKRLKHTIINGMLTYGLTCFVFLFWYISADAYRLFSYSSFPCIYSEIMLCYFLTLRSCQKMPPR